MNKLLTGIIKVRFLSTLLAISFLGLLIYSFYRDVNQTHKNIYSLALNEARSHFNKDVLYRRWAALEGGVYVPESKYTPSNPYLNVPHRDVETKEGQKLTLVNPAYMTRLVHELEFKDNRVKGHITSLNPIRPLNKADEWEEIALLSFEKGKKEFHSIQLKDDKSIFRYMGPLITEKPCLNCHAMQGYKVGDVRGGISISIPYSEYLTIANTDQRNNFIFHLIVAIVGLVGLFVVTKSSELHQIKIKNEHSKLLESEQRIRLIIENSPVGIFFFDTKGKILVCNSAFSNIIGSQKEKIIGLNLSNLPNKKVVECTLTTLKGLPGYFEDLYTTVTSDKSVYLRAIFTPVFDNDNIVLGGIAIVENFSERKNLEEQIKKDAEELEKINKDLQNSNSVIEKSLFEKSKFVEELLKAKDKLEKMNCEKDKFFSIIAHDLRSPFQGFIGLTEIFARNIDKYSLHELSVFMNEINSKAINLFKLLKNLLEWAKMQRGISTFEPIKTNLSQFTEQNIESIRLQAEKKSINIINRIEDGIIVFADENMVSSTLTNLLTNAIKFTGQNGEIVISSRNAEENKVEVTIADTGIGIPDIILKNLFKIQEKVGRLGTEGEESTGLGLLLCREFIEKHGGKIWAGSVVGEGSKFHFTLPLASN
ncbi:MAG: ATP-binding protein [bacterium]